MVAINGQVNPWRLGLWLFALVLILMPLAALQLVPGFGWGLEDFVAAATVIAITGLAVEVAVRMTRSPRLRLLSATLILLAAVAVWVELAVGILH